MDNLPLLGKTVLVTRPADQAAQMVNLLHQRGAKTIVQPVIQISEPDDWTKVDTAIDQIDRYDWIVFSSTNGVKMFCDRLEQRVGPQPNLANLKVAAIGPATAAALYERHISVDLVPESFRAEVLALALADEADGHKFLLPRANRGRTILPDFLTQWGADVDQVVVYKSTDLSPETAEIAPISAQLASSQIDWVTVTSSAIARSLARLFGENLKNTRLAAISPLTAETIRELGFTAAAIAKEYTIDGLIHAIVEVSNDESDL
jgi:uroporphyrinogen III methyltransferase / synthase